jgi:hypothetical protein
MTECALTPRFPKMREAPTAQKNMIAQSLAKLTEKTSTCAKVNN